MVKDVQFALTWVHRDAPELHAPDIAWVQNGLPNVGWTVKETFYAGTAAHFVKFCQTISECCRNVVEVLSKLR